MVLFCAHRDPLSARGGEGRGRSQEGLPPSKAGEGITLPSPRRDFHEDLRVGFLPSIPRHARVSDSRSWKSHLITADEICFLRCL
jgi:hypothetical protein